MEIISIIYKLLEYANTIENRWSIVFDYSKIGKDVFKNT